MDPKVLINILSNGEALLSCVTAIVGVSLYSKSQTEKAIFWILLSITLGVGAITIRL